MKINRKGEKVSNEVNAGEASQVQVQGQERYVLQAKYISNFRCNADVCLESCCTKYSTVRVDIGTYNLFSRSAPELLKNIGDSEEGFRVVLPYDNVCPFLENNRCTIQNKYGESYLPEICCFYPRIFRRLNDLILVSSALPCSEMVKNILFGSEAFEWVEAAYPRVQDNIANFLPEEIESDYVYSLLQMHDDVVNLVDKPLVSNELILVELLMLSQILDSTRKYDWGRSKDFILKRHAKYSVAETYNKYKKYDSLMIDDYVFSILSMSKMFRPPSFNATIYEVIDFLNKGGLERFEGIVAKYMAIGKLDLLLKRYLKAKLFEMVFPVCNWGECCDDTLLIIINYVGIRLCLAAYIDLHGEIPSDDTIVRIITDFESGFYGQRQMVYENFKDLGWTNFDKTMALLLCWYK